MLSRLEQPDRQELEALREPLELLPLIGPDQHAWDDEADLIAVRQMEGRDPFSKFVVRRDPFSKFVVRTVISFFHKVIGKHFKVGSSQRGSKLL